MIVDLDALALDARPVEDDYVRPRDRRPKNPRRPSGAARAGARRAADAADAADGRARRRRRRRRRPMRRPRHDPRGRRPHAVPGDARGAARREHPGADPGARPRDGARPRPAASGASARHRTVDDYTYGGGAGMVLRPEPVAAALAALRRPDSRRHPARSRRARSSARRRPRRSRPPAHLVFLCPRYEGVDERIRAMVDLELSIGDYVLTGGELAALVVIDAVLRLLPGAIDEASTAEESFAAGLLEYPQYTRPGDVRRRVGAPHARLGPPRGGPTLAAPRVAPSHAAAATGPAADRPLPRRRGACRETRSPTMARRRPRPARRTRRRRLTPAHRPCYPPPSAAPSRHAAHHREPSAAAAAAQRQGPVPVNVLNEIVAGPAAHRPPRDHPRRHRQGRREGRRGQPRARPGLRGPRDAHAEQRHRVDDHRPPDRRRASASSARSSSTARGSTASRSSATARSAARSCTSCATASARPRPPSASAARQLGDDGYARTPPREPDDPRQPGGRAMSGAGALRLAADGRDRPDAALGAPPVARRREPDRRAWTRSASPRPAAPSSRRP